MAGTFVFSSSAATVTGMVALEDAVENAVSSGVIIFFKCRRGETPNNFKTTDIVTSMRNESPAATVSAKSPSDLAAVAS